MLVNTSVTYPGHVPRLGGNMASAHVRVKTHLPCFMMILKELAGFWAGSAILLATARIRPYLHAGNETDRRLAGAANGR